MTTIRQRNTRRAAFVSGFLRIAVVALGVILQIALVVVLYFFLEEYSVYIYAVTEIAAGISILAMVSSSSSTPSYTIAWLSVVLVVPIFGLVLYIAFGWFNRSQRNFRRIREGFAHGYAYLPQNESVQAALGQKHPAALPVSRYLSRQGNAVFDRTDCDYYPLGELQFEAMLRDMAEAKHFIFMEYFIIDEGELWTRFSDMLIRKAREGVEVRFMYDDFGSLFTASPDHLRRMREAGVQVKKFNPVHRYISRLYINYRNHQKITVIDGNVGYTGGTNLADEYANLYQKHGHWKDTAIRLYGDAVWGLCVTFLQMWDTGASQPSDYEPYRPTRHGAGEGFYQPFMDGPANNPDNPAEVMYRTLISRACDYIYITTPYLVIDHDMVEALRAAAESGIDVRIVTPKIWDHWYVHMVTRSNYKALIRSGVRIYEYTPGYIHAKSILSDDLHAVTGSINMDYRSFYLHYENGVYITGAPVLADMRRDMESVFAVSEEITLRWCEEQKLYVRFLQAVLRLFAVLL